MQSQPRIRPGDDPLRADRPATCVGELVLGQQLREGVPRGLVLLHRETRVAVEALVTEVRLRGDQLVRRLVGLRDRGWEPGARSLREESPDQALGVCVLALAEVRVAHVSAPVDQVLGRPVLVPVGVPGSVVVVERYRVMDAVPLRRRPHVREIVLEREFRGVDADDDEPARAVAVVPGRHMRERAQTVDARVRPEVDQDDLPTQAGDRERTVAWRVQPVRDMPEVGRHAVIGQLPSVRRGSARDPAAAAAERGQLLTRRCVPFDLPL